VALVRFDSVDTASYAVTALNGQIPPGLSTPVNVRFAGSHKPQGQGSGPYGGKGAGKASAGWQAGNSWGQSPAANAESAAVDNIYIAGLPADMDNDTLKSIFEQFGTVTQHRVLPDKTGTATSAVALVRYDSADTASYAVANLNGQIPPGLSTPVTVTVRLAGSHKSGGQSAPGGVQKENLYVKNLPPTATESEVQMLFGQYGTVMSSKVFNFPTNSTAIVKFASADEAQWIMENVQGIVPEGGTMPLELQPHVKKGEGDAGGAGGKGGKGGLVVGGGEKSMKGLMHALVKAGNLPGGGQNHDATLYIQGLPSDCSDNDLYKLFNPFGALMSTGVRVMLTDDGSCKGIAFVNFQDVSAAEAAAAKFNGTVLPDGSHMMVKLKNAKGGGKGPAAPAAGGMWVPTQAAW